MNSSIITRAWFIALFLAMAFVPLFVIAQVSHTVAFNLSDFSFGKQDSFDVVLSDGLPASTESGAPMLPVKNVNLIVPSGRDVGSITITKKVLQVVTGNFRVYPSQAPMVTSINHQVRKFVTPNSSIYDSDSPYPATPIKATGASYFDGATRIVHLQVSPFEYKPLTGTLTLFREISFTVNLKPSSDKVIHVKRRARMAQNAYDQALRALVDNPEAISAYQQLPDLIYDDSISAGHTLISTVVQPDLPPSPPPYPLAGPLTIIWSGGLNSWLTSFINQKAADGISVKVVTTNQIYYYFPQSEGDQISSPAIKDAAGSIRQYLADEAYPDGCTWVLIVGDQNQVPVRYVPDFYAQYPGEQIPTDLYYSDLTGNWNPSNFQPNLSPTLFVGRIPVTSYPNDITTWTNKIIQYETNPFPGNPAAVTKVLWSSSDQIENEPDWVSTSFPSNFTHTFIKELPNGYDSNPTSPTGAQIISTLNSGYGFYSMDHHGSPAHVAVRTSGYNGYPKYGIFSYDSYTAGNYFSETGNGFDNTSNNCTILYSIACDVASYDSVASREGVPTNTECMASAWLHATGGGPAFLGNTREGLVYYSSVLEQRFLQQIFAGNTRIGQAEAMSKSAYGYASDGVFLAETHNLFGDPSMIMQTTMPSGNIVQNGALKKIQIPVESHNTPKEFGLSQNYPNPFNPSTSISFALPVNCRVTLKVYDILGREVVSLVDGYQSAGYHEVRFEGAKLSSGIYIYKLIAGNFVSVKKMLMVK